MASKQKHYNISITSATIYHPTKFIIVTGLVAYQICEILLDLKAPQKLEHFARAF